MTIINEKLIKCFSVQGFIIVFGDFLPRYTSLFWIWSVLVRLFNHYFSEKHSFVFPFQIKSSRFAIAFETRSLEDDFWSKSRCRRAAHDEFPAPVTVSRRATLAQCEHTSKLVLVVVLVLESKALYWLPQLRSYVLRSIVRFIHVKRSFSSTLQYYDT